jgi:hypothetical protein
MKKLSLTHEEETRPYPVIGNKQYVIPKGPKLTKGEELIKRQKFWYKYSLLKTLRISWKASHERVGQFHLLDAKITAAMMGYLKMHDVVLNVSVSNGTESAETSLWKSNFITLQVLNKKTVRIKPCIRIVPVEEINHKYEPLNWEGKFVVTGSFQTLIEQLNPNESAEYTIEVMFLSCGKYRFLYQCEDTLSHAMIWCSDPLTITAIE